jgi:hypothetical protein
MGQLSPAANAGPLSLAIISFVSRQVLMFGL